MKKTILSLAVIGIILFSCKKHDPATDSTVVTDTTSVKTETAEAAKPMDSAAMMKCWQDYMTPGAAHQMLAKDNGKWNGETTMWMSANDPKPVKSTMTAEGRMVMGGRYQEMHHKGMFMGQPFEGVSTMGYDNASKKLVSTWIDNMGTGIMMMTGDYDGKGTTMELAGQMTDPMSGKMKRVRETYTIVDDNTRKMEMYDTDAAGKEYKSMELNMTRAK